MSRCLPHELGPVTGYEGLWGFQESKLIYRGRGRMTA
jgi:hypothetical protein